MIEHIRQSYPSDLSEAQWHLLAPLIPPKIGRGENRKVNLREVVNAIFYQLPVVKGIICLTIFLPEIPFVTTSPNGKMTALWIKCNRHFIKKFVLPTVGNRLRRQVLSIVKPSRRRRWAENMVTMAARRSTVVKSYFCGRNGIRVGSVDYIVSN